MRAVTAATELGILNELAGVGIRGIPMERILVHLINGEAWRTGRATCSGDVLGRATLSARFAGGGIVGDHCRQSGWHPQRGVAGAGNVRTGAMGDGSGRGGMLGLGLEGGTLWRTAGRESAGPVGSTTLRGPGQRGIGWGADVCQKIVRRLVKWNRAANSLLVVGARAEPGNGYIEA